jgi:outer membrane protein TolC
MRTSLGQILVCLALLQGTALAESKLTLDQVIAKSLAGPKAKMAGADRDMAAARRDEADAARMPRFKATAFGTISPEIHCLDAACDQTSPKNFAFRFNGFFGSAQLDITQPLFTFGKIAHNREAARAGLDAQRALADETAGDIAVDAARAYWGLKLARELGGMLDDGIEEIDNAMKKFNDRTDLSIADRQRVAALLAEAKVQRAEAQQAEEQALAGLRALTGVPDADVDDEPLEALDRAVPVKADGSARPQAIAAAKGAHSYDELAAAAHSQYFPDLALVVSGIAAHAQGADDPPSAFANDPYNRSGAGLVLGLQ